MKRTAFTLIESLAVIVTIMVLTLIVSGIMRQKKIWPFDQIDEWLDARKPTGNISSGRNIPPQPIDLGRQ